MVANYGLLERIFCKSFLSWARYPLVVKVRRVNTFNEKFTVTYGKSNVSLLHQRSSISTSLQTVEAGMYLLTENQILLAFTGRLLLQSLF